MQKEHFDLSELVQHVSHEQDVTPEKARAILKTAFLCIADAVAMYGDAHFDGFGGFKLKKRAARSYNGFGKTVEKPERIAVEFTPAKAMKAKVQSATGKECIS
jgi:nucleoid DNA-binding protein